MRAHKRVNYASSQFIEIIYTCEFAKIRKVFTKRIYLFDSVSMERLKSAAQSALTKRKLKHCVKERADGMPPGFMVTFWQLLPDIYDHLLYVENSMVLVISPLNALMHNQKAERTKYFSLYDTMAWSPWCHVLQQRRLHYPVTIRGACKS